MNELILIAVGGSGARVAQSVVALAAAGFPNMFSKDESKLTVRVVDIDMFPGDGEELHDMVKSYHNAFQFLWTGSKQEIPGWRPLEINYNPSDSFFFKPALIKNAIDKTTKGLFTGLSDSELGKAMFEALYSEEDQELELINGCKGHPHIGALLWEYCYKEDLQNGNGFWSYIKDLAAKPNTRIMFVGSMFGGTGASGVPRLAKLVMNDTSSNDSVKVGVTLMAPYFSVHPRAEKAVSSGKPGADFSDDWFQSKMALTYYRDSELLNDVTNNASQSQDNESAADDKATIPSTNEHKINSSLDMFQVVGNSRNIEMKKFVGKIEEYVTYQQDGGANTSQNNPSVPAELTAAIGIIKFFTDKEPNEVFVPNTESLEHWRMFPDSEKLQEAIQQLARFCLMTSDYFASNVSAQKNLPAFVKELWPEATSYSQKAWKSFWTGNSGIGNAITFSTEFKRWLKDLYVNQMKVLEITQNSNELESNSEKGKTAATIFGKKLSNILSVMNYTTVTSAMDRVKQNGILPKQEAFIMSLMVACAAPKKFTL